MIGTLAIIAKAPRAGASKTRLCPPLSPTAAAELAEAALLDTLHAVAAASADRRVLVLDGAPGKWLPRGFEVIPQRGGGLDERLAWAFADLGGPALIVGMDTPQLTTELLERAVRQLGRHDALLGPALDGGYWAIGLRRPDSSALRGIPMSSHHTLAAQYARLHSLGLHTGWLPPLRDVDTFADAVAVAQAAPHTRFARSLRSLSAARQAA